VKKITFGDFDFEHSRVWVGLCRDKDDKDRVPTISSFQGPRRALFHITEDPTLYFFCLGVK